MKPTISLLQVLPFDVLFDSANVIILFSKHHSSFIQLRSVCLSAPTASAMQWDPLRPSFSFQATYRQPNKPGSSCRALRWAICEDEPGTQVFEPVTINSSHKSVRVSQKLRRNQLTCGTRCFASISTTGVDCFDAIEVHNLQNSIAVTSYKFYITFTPLQLF